METSKQSQTAHALNFLVLALLFFITVESFDRVPDPMPVHYDFHGNPDRWGPKNLLGWLVGPIIATVNTFFMYAIGYFFRWLNKYPSMFNLPKAQKAKFLSLDEEQRLTVINAMKSYMYCFPIPMNALFLWLAMSDRYSMLSGLLPRVSFWIPLTVSMIWIFILVALMIRTTGRTIESID
jgi:uncharacterized membrane protein